MTDEEFTKLLSPYLIEIEHKYFYDSGYDDDLPDFCQRAIKKAQYSGRRAHFGEEECKTDENWFIYLFQDDVYDDKLYYIFYNGEYSGYEIYKIKEGQTNKVIDILEHNAY